MKRYILSFSTTLGMLFLALPTLAMEPQEYPSPGAAVRQPTLHPQLSEEYNGENPNVVLAAPTVETGNSPEEKYPYNAWQKPKKTKIILNEETPPLELLNVLEKAHMQMTQAEKVFVKRVEKTKICLPLLDKKYKSTDSEGLILTHLKELELLSKNFSNFLAKNEELMVTFSAKVLQEEQETKTKTVTEEIKPVRAPLNVQKFIKEIKFLEQRLFPLFGCFEPTSNNTVGLSESWNPLEFNTHLSSLRALASKLSYSDSISGDNNIVFKQDGDDELSDKEFLANCLHTFLPYLKENIENENLLPQGTSSDNFKKGLEELKNYLDENLIKKTS